VVAAAALALVLGATGGAQAAQPRAAGHDLSMAMASIGAPVPSGTLRVTGSFRDGGTIAAAGLSWRPGQLPASDRLLTFEVGYYWHACAGTSCRTAADTTVSPFAAQRYIVGHADVGRTLRLTETATEVIETNPATFSFSVISRSRSFTSRVLVRGLRPRTRPFTEFINGLPEHTTASNSENLQIDPPHYARADGPVVISYRIDQARWRPMPKRLVFSTGRLGLGRHRVEVEVSNRAGHTPLTFRWRVVPLPAPLTCQGTCWYPPHLDKTGHPMRWDWQIGLVAPLQRTGRRAVDIYDIDGFLTTPAQVSAIHRSWRARTLPHPKTICYLDLAWEDYRPDASPSPGAPRGATALIPATTLGNVYFGYPQERWVDFRQLDALRPMLTERIAMCARKGFDAVEFDDIEVTDNATGFHLTAGDTKNLLAYAFNLAHSEGMTVLWKNTPALTRWGVRYSDGAVVEECYAFGGCRSWDVFTTDKTSAQPTGKWVGEAEYGADRYVCNPGQRCKDGRSFTVFCRRVWAPAYGFAAVKFDVNLDGKVFFPCPLGI
jgi:hypothetical protein